MTAFGLFSSLLAACLLYLPGIALGRRIGRASSTPASAWAFPCSLALLQTGLFAGRLLGWSLSRAGGIVAVLALAGVAWSALDLRVRERASATPSGVRPDERTRSVRPAEWILIALAGILLLIAGGPLGLKFDSLDHLGSIRRSLLSDTILPLDEFYRGGDGQGWDPRKGFLPALLALVCRWTRSDPGALWRFLPAVMAPGMLLAVSGLLRGWLRPGRLSDVALGVWILVGGGSGFLWLSRAGYPNHPAYALGFFAIGLYISSLREGRASRGLLAGIALLVYAAELMHLVPGLFVGMALGLGLSAALLPGRERAAQVRATVACGLAALAGLALPLAFRVLTQGPLVSTCHTHPQGLLELGRGMVTASPLFILFYAGWVVVVALPLLPLAAAGAESGIRRPLLALTLGPWLLTGTPLFTAVRAVLGYLGVRFLDVVPAVPVVVLAAAEAVRRLWPALASRTGRGSASGTGIEAGGFPAGVRMGTGARVGAAATLLLAVTFVGANLVRFPAVVASAVADRTGPHSANAFAALLDAVPRTNEAGEVPLVLADPFTSYALTGLTGAYVISTLDQHGPPTDAAWRVRLDEQREMLYAANGAARADSLIRLRGVDYVVLNRALPLPVSQFGAQVTADMLRTAEARFRADGERFREIHAGGDGSVFRVVPEAFGGGPADPAVAKGSLNPPVPQPAREASAAANPGPALHPPRGGAELLDFGAIEALSIRLPAGPSTLGTTIGLPLVWVRTGEIASDLPLWVEMRCIGPKAPVPGAGSRFGRPFRLLTQVMRHRFYSFRIAVMPFGGMRDLRDLPLGVAVPDTLHLYLPWPSVPGEYALQIRLYEETFLPNLNLGDLLRDERPEDAPVVGRLLLQPDLPGQGAR